jgi:hypothetical protein
MCIYYTYTIHIYIVLPNRGSYADFTRFDLRSTVVRPRSNLVSPMVTPRLCGRGEV